MEKKYEIAYICNGKVPKCSGKQGCYYRKDDRHGPCSHTTDSKYAKNIMFDPEKNPDIFEKFQYGELIRYYEKYVND